MIVTAGVDVGASAVKTAVVAFDGEQPRSLALVTERIRKRELRSVVEGCFQRALEKAGLAPSDVDYVASTGAGELVEFRRGHFYGMTSHARGARFLLPEARTVPNVWPPTSISVAPWRMWLAARSVVSKASIIRSGETLPSSARHASARIALVIARGTFGRLWRQHLRRILGWDSTAGGFATRSMLGTIA